MNEQDNEPFKDRVFHAVVSAVMDVSRIPGSPDSHMNVNEALEGMCAAIVGIVATVAISPVDREQAAELIETMEKEISRRLGIFAAKTRSGEWRAPPGPPNLRLVD